MLRLKQKTNGDIWKPLLASCCIFHCQITPVCVFVPHAIFFAKTRWTNEQNITQPRVFRYGQRKENHSIGNRPNFMNNCVYFHATFAHVVNRRWIFPNHNHTDSEGENTDEGESKKCNFWKWFHFRDSVSVPLFFLSHLGSKLFFDVFYIHPTYFPWAIICGSIPTILVYVYWLNHRKSAFFTINQYFS